MNEISCEICMDLMPLVADGVASGDSRKAVQQHIKTCDFCRAFFEGEKTPETGGEQALSKAIKKVQTVCAVCLAFVILLGICLCELVMQGSSVFFLITAAIIGWLIRFGFRKGSGKNQTVKRIAAFLAAAVLITALCWGADALFGNPFTKKQAEKTVQQYLREQYGELDLYIDGVSYEMKSTSYRADVRSRTSIDTWFEVIYEDGEVQRDTYEENVLSGHNTLERISEEYRKIALPVLKLVGLECDIYGANTEISLGQTELDGQYDIMALAARTGRLSVTLGDETVTEERAAELLLDIKERMDAQGIAFASIDFSLWNPQDPDEPQSWQGARDGGTVELENFPYDDICEDGLVQWVCAANKDDEAYHASRE